MRTITGNIVAMKMRKSLLELNLRLKMAHVMVWISIGKVNVAMVISTIQTTHTIILLVCTARPRDTRILVPEKNRAAQNRAS